MRDADGKPQNLTADATDATDFHGSGNRVIAGDLVIGKEIYR